MLSQVLILKKELDALRPIGREQEAIIMQKFRLDWNYHSNHLEGNSLTYGETKTLILFGLTAQGKPLKDHFEITGHDEAVKWIEDIVKQDRPLTESFIRELHTLLLKESYQKKAQSPSGIATTRDIKVGQYKSVPNHVLTQTGEMFYFASPEETPAKMHDLMDWFREKQANQATEPVLLAAEFHYRFIRIHPFDDGNGRTARLLMNFILMQYGYPPVIIKTEDKQNYFNVLRLADAGNLEPFVDYIADNLSRSLEIMLKGAKGESIEDPDDLDKEIALLEQKLKGVGEKIEVVKSIDVMTQIYNNSFNRLTRKYIKESEKFDRFYLKKEIVFLSDNEWVANTFLEVEYFLKIFYSNANYNPKNLGLKLNFVSINQLRLTDVMFSTGIIIEFENGYYNIKALFDVAKTKIYFKKPYSEQLTDEEINLIVNTEMKRHTAFIEDKIKEIQAQ
ncbi:MAG: Fic family protein [Arcicella sp.]|jgi:Fic family protein|nr:Fic family protein [Arcicella sp.]